MHPMKVQHKAVEKILEKIVFLFQMMYLSHNILVVLIQIH